MYFLCTERMASKVANLKEMSLRDETDQEEIYNTVKARNKAPGGNDSSRPKPGRY